MKTKKSLACLLACLMTVGTMAFAACDEGMVDSGTSENSAESSMDGSSVTDDGQSSVIDNASDDGQSESSVKEKDPVKEAAWEALQAALKKTENCKNYTLTESGVYTESGEEAGESFWYSQKVDSVTKYDGNWEEEYSETRRKENPSAPWGEIEKERTYREYTSETGGKFYEQDEDGSWSGGVFETSEAFGNIEFFDKGDVETLYEMLVYDEETGVYTLTEYTFDMLDGLFDDMPVTVEGWAKTTYHKMEIELKDGYVYRLYMDYEVDINVTIVSIEDSSIEEELDTLVQIGKYTSNVTWIYTDYEKTVVTLPEIAK